MCPIMEGDRVLDPIRLTHKQEPFVACEADIALFGGGAGPGKTFAALFDQARWASKVPGFTGVFFRKTYPQIMSPGALWDESANLLPKFGGVGIRSDTRWDFKNNSWIKFSHLQHESSIDGWQGSQLTVATFDELTHFSERTFFYLLSRLRSKCGVRPYLRGTCNPLPNSWVARLIDWWLDPLTGYPIMSRAGVVRWFVRNGNKMIWADYPQELPPEINGKKTIPKSFTFFPALATDNPYLDPDYIGNLGALPLYERMLLEEGNWKVRPDSGMRFKRKWFGEPANPPAEFERVIRYWDRASTEPSTQNADPDYTAGVKLGRTAQGQTWILDVARDRLRPAGVRKLIERCAVHDGPDCELWMDQDPASAGEAEKMDLSKELSRFAPRFTRPTGSKWKRSEGVSAGAENGLIQIARGSWNEEYLDEMEGFVDEKQVDTPQGYHDDQVDASASAWNTLDVDGPRIRSL